MITYIKKVRDYLQGYIRYYLYYKCKGMFIRKHIIEQFKYRVFNMDHECYQTGSCKMCGCDTTALQMANKACDKPCYPEMMNKKDWNTFKNNMKNGELLGI